MLVGHWSAVTKRLGSIPVPCALPVSLLAIESCMDKSMTDYVQAANLLYTLYLGWFDNHLRLVCIGDYTLCTNRHLEWTSR